MENQPVIKLEDCLYTDYSGIKQIFNFYHKAAEFYNTTVYIDFYELNWMDANLSALFGAVLHKLTEENKLQFSADLNYVESKLNVLFRNGFLNSENINADDQNSTISFRSFDCTDKVGFISYIENDLLQHRGMPNLDSSAKDNIIDSLIEVFCNIQIHAKTNHPFFVCGQFYPKQKKLLFTIVDLGVGFLPAIQQKTEGAIDCSENAIQWAIQKGNTTKQHKPGGIGLSDLYSYFKETNGNLQIITGDTFWAIELEKTAIPHFKFQNPFVGSILNLFFQCN